MKYITFYTDIDYSSLLHNGPTTWPAVMGIDVQRNLCYAVEIIIGQIATGASPD